MLSTWNTTVKYRKDTPKNVMCTVAGCGMRGIDQVSISRSGEFVGLVV